MTRHPDDFYATPPWVTRAILPHLPRVSVVLDPCCGEGAILDVFAERGAGGGVVDLRGIELDATRALAARSGASVVCADALAMRWRPAQLVVMNPPFSLASEFVAKALTDGCGVTVAAFLRLAFMESQGRADFHRKHPSDVYVLSQRPSFTPDGKTDQWAYGWFVWGPGRGGRWSILDCAPPKRERRNRSHSATTGAT